MVVLIILKFHKICYFSLNYSALIFLGSMQSLYCRDLTILYTCFRSAGASAFCWASADITQTEIACHGLHVQQSPPEPATGSLAAVAEAAP